MNNKKNNNQISKSLLFYSMATIFCLSLIFFFVTATRVSVKDLRSSGASVLGWNTQRELEKKELVKTRLQIADNLLKTKPNPIKKISMEGTVNADLRRIQSVKSLADMGTIFNLAYAYKTTDDDKYLKKASEFILAWANTYVASGNSIDESQLQPLYDGYAWVRPSISSADVKKIDLWLNSIAEAEMNIKYNDGKDLNNWNSYRISIIGQIGYLTSTKKFINYATNAYKEQIENNLRPDGSSFDLETRDSLEYHCYNLIALLRFAKISRQHGHDLYAYQSPSGSSLKKSLHYLFPYVTGQKTHAEYVNSVVEWDRIKATANRQNAVGSIFEPKDALDTLELAYYLDDSVLPLVQELRNSRNAYPSFQIALADEQKDETVNVKP